MVEVAVGGNVPRIEPLCFEGFVIDWSLKDPVVVIIPIVHVKDTVVVMVVRVGAVASIESLEQVVDAVVVVIKVVKVVDAVVVVVACTCFFEEGEYEGWPASKTERSTMMPEETPGSDHMRFERAS